MAKQQTTQTETKAPAFIAWHISEKGDKAFWTRVGAAWSHKDGQGLTLQFDMIPLHGRVVLREPQTTEGNGGSQ